MDQMQLVTKHTDSIFLRPMPMSTWQQTSTTMSQNLATVRVQLEQIWTGDSRGSEAEKQQPDEEEQKEHGEEEVKDDLGSGYCQSSSKSKVAGQLTSEQAIELEQRSMEIPEKEEGDGKAISE